MGGHVRMEKISFTFAAPWPVWQILGPDSEAVLLLGGLGRGACALQRPFGGHLKMVEMGNRCFLLSSSFFDI